MKKYSPRRKISPSHKPNKRLGQHFLISPQVLEEIIVAARIASNDTVLEIGPGEGVLTERLLEKAGRVVAVEKDASLSTHLTRRFAREIQSGQLEVHTEDIRNLKLEDTGLKDHAYIVVSNIPYYLTGEILRRLLSETPQPKSLILLVQKEVAERIARSKKESLLSLSVKAYGDPHYVATVPRGAFRPHPRVDSAILAIENVSKKFFSTLNETEFFNILHMGFKNKRKQLSHNLSPHVTKESITTFLTKRGFPVGSRAEDLPLRTWNELIEFFKKNNPHERRGKK